MKIKFIKHPESVAINITGAIYEQITPFKTIYHDWNNDGDTYPRIIAEFALLDHGTQDPFYIRHIPRKLIFARWEIEEMLKHNEIIMED